MNSSSFKLLKYSRKAYSKRSESVGNSIVIQIFKIENFKKFYL